jgi:hypothetical protein
VPTIESPGDISQKEFIGICPSFDSALPYLQVEADKKILCDFMKTVPSGGSIKFLRTNNFGFSFDLRNLDDIDAFLQNNDGPDHEFIDHELEAPRQEFRKSCRTFLGAIAVNTFPTSRDHRQPVPDDWEIDNPKRFDEAVDEIHRGSDAVCNTL